MCVPPCRHQDQRLVLGVDDVPVVYYLTSDPWFRNDVTEPTIYTWKVTAEFVAVAGRVANGGIHDCGISAFAECSIAAYECQLLQTVSPQLNPGTYHFFVAPLFSDIILCADKNRTRYRATLSCERPIPPCPWDINGNLSVDFQDLLQLLANWGPCPGT